MAENNVKGETKQNQEVGKAVLHLCQIDPSVPDKVLNFENKR